MDFEPMGGFPPIIRKTENIDTDTLQSRGFATTNIVSIGNILSSKKKENLLTAFGTESEDGTEFLIESILNKKPIRYRDIEYKSLDRRLAENAENRINKI